LTEEGEMQRYVWLLLLLAGCAKEPYPRLAGGSDAYVFSPDGPEVRVGTEMGKGMLESDYELLANGTRVRVLDDPGDVSQPARRVQAGVREGKREGLPIAVERRFLRPIGD
jgi:hypothetical protein